MPDQGLAKGGLPATRFCKQSFSETQRAVHLHVYIFSVDVSDIKPRS